MFNFFKTKTVASCICNITKAINQLQEVAQKQQAAADFHAALAKEAEKACEHAVQEAAKALRIEGKLKELVE